jgi:hypothetical protein
MGFSIIEKDHKQDPAIPGDIEFGKHLKFVPGPPKPKTKTWWVVNRYDDIHLGWVAWFPRWRKYSFFVKPDRVFEQDCLRDIADFVERKTKEHKE